MSTHDEGNNKAKNAAPTPATMGQHSAKIAKPPLSALESEPLIWFASMFILIISMVFLTGMRTDDRIVNLSIVFLAIVFEAFPFMMIGAIISGFIEVYVSEERIAKMMSGNRFPIIFAALLGLILPVCECAIIPVVRRLVIKGVPFSCAIAYMLASPTINPLVTASTGVAFTWNLQYVLGRFLGGFLIAVVGGYLLGKLFPGKKGLKNGDKNAHNHSHGGHYPAHGGTCGLNKYSNFPFKEKMRAVFLHGAVDFIDVARFLVLGAFIAASIRTFVNWERLLDLNSSAAASPWVLMLLAFVMNLCSEADAFIAASFITFRFHAKMAFLILGPMLDIKLLAMFSTVYTKKAIIAIVILLPLLVYALSMLFYWIPWFSG